MSLANTSLVVTPLNFNDIKNNLKTFLASQSEFSDYNYENSTISILINLLAYNTYQNAFYTNMVANESFLDTALLRPNVVSKAKALGYIPRSCGSANAVIQATFSPTDSPNEIIIPAYTSFGATLDGLNYSFTTNQDTIVLNNNGTYTKTFNIFEGTVLTYTFTYDGSKQFFELPNPNLDMSSLVVKVKANSGASSATTYTLATDITQVTATSTVYFLQENGSGNYELYFGDGVLGLPLSTGNVILVTARFCAGSAVNGISYFSAVGNIGYNSNNQASVYTASVSTVSAASGGQDKEDIESIRFNAPKFFARQNRLVTTDDYRSFLLAQYTDLQSVAVWGGEDNAPPVYGVVFIAIKPTNGFVLSQARKNAILSQLQARNTLTIEPILIDPYFTYVNPTITIMYNPSLTSLNASAIYAEVSTAVTSFETTNLGVFGNSFYQDRFSAALDAVDASIISADVSFVLEKRIAPIFNSSLTYQLNFNASLFHPYDGYLGTLSSHGFILSGSSDVCYLDDDGFGNVRIYTLLSSLKVYKNTNAGTINYNTGSVTITGIIFSQLQDSGGELRVMVNPTNSYFTPTNNVVVLLSYPAITLFNTNLNSVSQSGVVSAQGNISPLVNANVISPIYF